MRGIDKHRVTFSPLQATVLSAVADRIVPGGNGFPTPTDARVMDDFMPRYVAPDDAEVLYLPGVVLSDVDRLADTLGAGFADAPADEQDAALRRLEADDAALFGKVRALVYFGYYSRPEVRSAIASNLEAGHDYRRAPQPYGYDDVIEDWQPSLLDAVRGGHTPTDQITPVDPDALAAMVASWPTSPAEGAA